VTALKPGPLPPWLVAILSLAAFGASWLVLGKSRWLLLALQLWLGYALAWLALQVIDRWTSLRALPTLITLTVLAAAIAGLLVLPLSHDFLLDRLRSWTWVSVRGLPPAIFALAFLLPGMVLNWREQQKHQRQLALVEQRRAVAELSKQVTLAELKSLQAQVEPHFLYNTLAGVQYLVRRNAVLADEMLGHLITYLRRAVPSMRAQTSTVQAECELVQAYLEVMKLRLGERLQTRVDCSPNAAAFPMPPMMLATLVENAIKHGIEPLPQGGRIDVKAEIHGACYVRRSPGLISSRLPSIFESTRQIDAGFSLRRKPKGIGRYTFAIVGIYKTTTTQKRPAYEQNSSEHHHA